MVRGIGTVLGLLAYLGLSADLASAQSDAGTPRVMQGPMLGPVDAGAASVWVRGNGPFAYRIEYSADRDFARSERTAPLTAAKADDYTMVFRITDLSPDTRYYYRVLVEDAPDKYLGTRQSARFRTAEAGPGRFRVAYGSCARVQASTRQPIWTALAAAEPDLFFWTGDNIYGDSMDMDILAEEYRRQRDLLELQPVLQGVTHLATWDDHDFALNNHNRTNPVKEGALEVFRRYWANPASGLADTPGVFFKHSYEGVDFFFLDVRYHRDPNDDPVGPQKTMLGRAQYDWLVGELAASRAPFKLLVSGSGFTAGKGPRGDAWSAFLHERDRLFTTIFDRGIGGVLLMSGDTHCAELNRIEFPHPKGYALTEVVSSPLAQQPSAGPRPTLSGYESRLEPIYNRATNAGILDFDLHAVDPTVTIRLINEYGDEVWTPRVIRASDLTVRP
jgi:alkaline phosphatase D